MARKGEIEMMRQISKKVREEKGFTLVEGLVAVVISLIVAFGFYSLYNHQHKQYLSEQITSDNQANARFIIDALGNDLIMAGYRPITAPGVSLANSNTITFEYWDERHEPTGTYDKHVQITFAIDTTDPERPLYRTFENYNTSTSTFDELNSTPIGKHVQSLNFEYFDSTNTDLGTPGTTLATLEEIRNIKVTVNVQSYNKDPFTDQYKTITLSGTYRARNLGIAGTPEDPFPPAPPAYVEVVDPGVCGQLDLRWCASGAPDLAGYYIYIGQESGVYYDKIKVAPSATDYTLSGLTSTYSDDSVQVTYFIAMSAFDNSMNISALTPEITGDPGGNTRVFTGDVCTAGGTVNDTTINPEKPLPPGSFAAADGAEGQVVLTWTPSTSDEVVGYQLHRALFPDFVPDGSTLIADEDALTAVEVTYTDTGLIGCVNYYYKIASVNCDTTLIPSYSSIDYSDCYGDGGMADVDPDFPVDSITDSTPVDNTPIDGEPYPVPVLSSYAGWRRVFLSLTNPNHTDDPDFDHTKIFWDFDGFPTVDENCNVSGGQLVPDRGGIFTEPGSGGSNSFIHDHPTLEDPPEPSLTDPHEEVTVYYLAVSYDNCGNCTSATLEATTLSELCGDDPVGLPEGGDGLTVEAEGCSGYFHLSWNEGDLKTASHDFAGYHVYRNEGSSYDEGDPSHVELTGGVPQWSNSFSDAGVNDSQIYSYAVRYTDCAWEHDNDGHISPPHVIENLSLGRLREESNERVLTGDLLRVPPDHRHNVVTFFLRNTSAGSLTMKTMSLRWDNPLAFLQKIVIGDNSTTSKEIVWAEVANPLVFGSTGGSATLDKLIDAADEQVPVELHFALSDGAVNEDADMREDTIYLEAWYRNNTTESADCYGTGTIEVLLGPVVTRTSQNMPSVATPAWPVPGPGGNNSKDRIIVPGGVAVTVNTLAFDRSGVGVDDVSLYYFVDSSASLDEAPVFDGTNYTEIPMTLVSGFLWKLASGDEIPAGDGVSVWYYIVAVDNDGNFDRQPELHEGAFQYFQQPADVCGNTPEPPVIIDAYDTGGSVVLHWDPPAANTDSSPLVDLDGFRVYRTEGSAWVLMEEIPDPDAIEYIDYPSEIDTIDYSYHVTAFDTCTPPNESLASNVFTECAGAPPCVFSVTPSGIIEAGDAINISLTVCDRINSTPFEIIYAQTCSSLDFDPIRLREAEDRGIFYVDQGYYGGLSSIQTHLTADYPSTPTDLDLEVESSDTVIIGSYRDVAYSNSICEDPHECNTFYITVEADPCASPATPSEPLNLSSTRTKSNCGSSGNKVNLSWVAPVTGPVSHYRIYRCQGAGCDPMLLPPLGAMPTGTTYQDSPPAKLDNNFRYRVTAVNAECTGNTRESDPSNITQQCP